jgi:hypothetical protein
MTLPQSSRPSWVRKRDGRLVPFQSDRISQALFAASETAGRPDPFLVRELADVVVHFLTEETEGTTPTTEQIQEVVVKVLRELKQPALATAYESRARRTSPPAAEEQTRQQVVVTLSPSDAPAVISEASLKSYSLQSVYTRDLVAAHQDGLIVLGGLETPGELAASLVGPFRRIEELLPRLEEAASVTGQTLALDGIDHVLARSLPASPKRLSRPRIEETARSVTDVLLLGLRMIRRQAVVNLNGEAPPWVDAFAEGPLFATQHRRVNPQRASQLAEAVAEILLESESSPLQVRVDWHLSAKDCTKKAKDRLLPLARAALDGAELGFVFDRLRHPVALAEGLERKHPAVLLMVGLNLARLASLVKEEVVDGPGRSERLLKRLGSLARMALSAALQKRDYLRKHVDDPPGVTSGFLLERARLVVVPLGLDQTVRTLLGQGLCSSKEGQELGSAILRRLRAVLRDEGRASTLETCIESRLLINRSKNGREEPASPEEMRMTIAERGEASLICSDDEAPLKTQLKTIGVLHAAAGAGSGLVSLPEEPPTTADQVADWLCWAYSHTSIVRLHLGVARFPMKQMTFSDT